MSATKILDEAERLQRLSDRLDSLAEQHPKASDALLRIASGIRDTAVLLEVLVATKLSSPSRLQ
jgi:nitrogen-specific signal transduction histidine kinase